MRKFGMAGACLLVAWASSARAEDSAWVQLFNGKDLTDWVVRFSGKPVGENVENAFRVENGMLTVRLEKNIGFGHIYYNKRAFSYYLVRTEYKFLADKSATGYASWTNQNNGLMLHSQAAKDVGGDFPNSIEVQLLGPKTTNSTGAPSADWPVGHSANLCTPGTFVAYNGNNNYTTHCTTAQYPEAWKRTQTPWNNEFSNVTVRVLADSLFEHFINGARVFQYTKIRLDNGTPLKQGYIAIQAEGTSAQFKKVELLDLTGCMDKQSPAYRTYFVKHEASACAGTGTAGPGAAAQAVRFARAGGRLAVEAPSGAIVEILGLDGALLARSRSAGAPVELPDRAGAGGLRVLRVRGAGGDLLAKSLIP